jgi:hypothetical protein
MAGEPNELPEGGEGGGGGYWGGFRGEFPAELPGPDSRFDRVSSALLREVLQLRNRIQQVENAQFMASALGRASFSASRISFGIGGPNELPEGGEGGGGFGGFHGEFPGEIAEIPVDPNLFQRFSELATRLTAFETRVVAALEGLEARVNELAEAKKR